MKNKKIKVIVLIFLIFILSGCTKILKDDKNNVVKYDSSIICNSCNSTCKSKQEQYDSLKLIEKKSKEELATYKKLEDELKTCSSDCAKKCDLAKKNETEQSLTKNILCKPTNTDVIEIYKKYNVNIDKLPSCDNFNPFSTYEGLWATGFVRPLTWLIIKTGDVFNNYGLSLILISILIRAIMIPLTKKTSMQSENLKKAQPEIDKINKKYEGKTDQESNTKKSQETLVLYKKYDINPLSSCLFAIIQIPLLFAFIEAINRTPAIFEGKFLGLRLGLTPTAAIKSGQWWYIILIVILVAVTYFSMNFNQTASVGGSDTEKQMKVMNKVMIVFIAFASFGLSTAICIYWIASSSVTLIQNLLVKKAKK